MRFEEAKRILHGIASTVNRTRVWISRGLCKTRPAAKITARKKKTCPKTKSAPRNFARRALYLPAEMDSKCGQLCLAGHSEFHGRYNFAVKLYGHLILANKLDRIGELDLAAVNREALRCK